MKQKIWIEIILLFSLGLVVILTAHRELSTDLKNLEVDSLEANIAYERMVEIEAISSQEKKVEIQHLKYLLTGKAKSLRFFKEELAKLETTLDKAGEKYGLSSRVSFIAFKETLKRKNKFLQRANRKRELGIEHSLQVLLENRGVKISEMSAGASRQTIESARNEVQRRFENKQKSLVRLQRTSAIFYVVFIFVFGVCSLIILKHLRIQNKYEKELFQASLKAKNDSRTKSDFLANMSHEIRTPLNAIVGVIDLLLDGQKLPVQKRPMGMLKSSSESLLSLVDEILDLSKIESGSFELDVVSFKVSEVFSDVENILSYKSSVKGLELRIENTLHPDSFIDTDPTRLKQVLINIGSNALKFTDKGSVVFTVREEQGLSIVIKDTGIGIAADKMKKIFDPYKQAEASTSGHYGGTGLGLSISKKFVQLMGGILQVESQVGEGTEFTIQLPVTANIKKPIQKLCIPAKVEKASQRSKVLIVDDIAENRMLLELYLEKAGYHLEFAKNGLEALKLCHQNSFDLLLMDLQMPTMGGLEAIEKIRQRESEQNSKPVPAIALTAQAFQMDVQACRSAGFDNHLAKPIRKAHLMEVIENLIDKEPRNDVA